MHVSADFTHIVVEHRSLVERALRRGGVQERDLPDATQDVFMVVHRRLPSFEGRARLSTWIYRIASHVASQYRRRAHRRHELLQDADVETGNAPEHERDEAVRHAQQALQALDADKREVFVRFELQEAPMASIAAHLRIPLKTAFSRLYAARRDLGRRMREQGFAWMWLDAWWRRAPQPMLFASSVVILSSWAVFTPTAFTPALQSSSPGAHVTAQPIRPATSARPMAQASRADDTLRSTATVTEHVAPPSVATASPEFARRPGVNTATRAQRTAADVTSEPSVPIETVSVSDELVVFHDSEVIAAPHVPPPMQAELAPAALREPRIALRGPQAVSLRDR